MRPANFEYFSPTTLQQAAALLAESEGAGRILAGGQSLMAAMNLRLSKPSRLVDLRRIPGLDSIEIGADKVRIGAMTRHADIIGHDGLHRRIPLFRQAGRNIAHATIREHGTMGGSMSLADPAAEWATVLSLLGARLQVVSTEGERWIPVEEFFVSYYTTALTENEILTAIEVPLPPQSTYFGFMEFSRQSGAFALAMVAVALQVNAGRVDHIKGCVGACSARPALLQLDAPGGALPDDQAVDASFDALGLEPADDIHAAAQDRKQIAKTLLRRCLAAAYAQSKGA